MTDLLIDVGNSGVKWALLDASELEVKRYRSDSGRLAQELWRAAGSDVPVWVSSVAGEEADRVLRAALAQVGFSNTHFCSTPERECGLVNSYSDPHRLGVDRWLAMLGAWCRERGPLMVVDAGSALTCDLVSDAGQHLGGYILPGPAMMESSLLAGTSRIRYDEANEPSLEAGRDTAACVSAGVWSAALGAIASIRERYPRYRVIVTGGDAPTLRALGLQGEWHPNLVLQGLAERAGRADPEEMT